MKCAIHQPQFLPWLGYLHKIHSVDKFVFLDNVQFKKNEFQNRNRLLVAGAARWLTVPVSFHFGDTLLETRIADTVPWRKKMMHALDLNYAKTPFFRQFQESLERVIEQEWKSLAELNEATVRWLMKCFDMHTETFTSSRFPELSPEPTRRLIDICRRVGADTYLSGAGGHKYLEPAEFEKAGIKLEFQEFQHPVYPQYALTLSWRAATKCVSRECHSRERGNPENSILDSHFHGNDKMEKSSQENKKMPDRSMKEESVFIANLSAVDGLFNCGGGAAGRKMLKIE